MRKDKCSAAVRAGVRNGKAKGKRQGTATSSRRCGKDCQTTGVWSIVARDWPGDGLCVAKRLRKLRKRSEKRSLS
jgi:hypothetical protein